MTRTSNKQLTISDNKLTKRQLAFIDALISNGGNLELAALKAGYARSSARNAAYVTMRLSHVQAEFRTRLIQKLGAAAAGSINTISDLQATAQSEPVRLAAAKDILDRFGLSAEKQQQTGGITINIGLSREQSASKTIDGTAQAIDDQGIISAGLGDTLSPEGE